jgi:hypothetical protein
LARLVLLDADVVIRAFELHIWDRLVDKYEVVLAGTVCNEVRDYFDPATAARKDINLKSYIADGRIKLVDAPLIWAAEIDAFCRARLGGLHGKGELESIAIVKHETRDVQFCTADGYAIRTMVLLGYGSRLVSLEKLLRSVGLSRKFETREDYQYSDARFKKCLKDGSIRRTETERLT